MTDIFAQVEKFAGQQKERWIADGKQVAIDSAAEGEELVRERIRTAVTPWGEKRHAEGRESAGRIETSDMIDAVGSRIADEGDDFIETAWGWAPEVLEDYFMTQEHGFRDSQKMTPMNSLAQSRDIVEDALPTRLNGILR